jgi:membrane-bound metal-dependent hydrolase YbcI (DUF457 family)
MPSPVAHLLAGVSTAWAADALASSRYRPASDSLAVSAALPAMAPLTMLCAALAVAPDIDILSSSHRTVTHSVGALCLVAATVALAARWRGWPVFATTLACAIAFGSHLLLDWLGHDSSLPAGLMALWPFSDAFYISGIDLFADVSRRYWRPEEFVFGNALSISRELAILLPVAAVAWVARARGRRLARERHLARGPQTPGS